MKLRTSLILLLFITVSAVHAQRYNFKVYNVRDGLANSSVASITEDENGYIWLGTYGGGISKFDGITFTNYTLKEGLPSNTIECAITDKNGLLWFGTEKDGLFSYDGERFNTISSDQGLISNNIRCLHQHSDGNIWVGTTKGISIISKDTIYNYSANDNLPNNHITSIIEDKTNRTFIGTYNGISIIENGKLDSLKVEDGLINKYVQTLTEDKEGNIWIGTIQGISVYKDGAFNNIILEGGQAGNWVESIELDDNDNIWIATRGGGVHRNDGDNFIQITDKEGLNSNAVMSLYKDSSGIFWLGTVGGGVNKYVDDGFTHLSKAEGLAHDLVYPLHEDKNKDIWVGTYGGGVSQIYSKTGKIKNYTTKDGLSGDNVFAIFENKRDEIWMGTMTGLNKKVGDKFVQHPKYKNISIWSMLEDNNGDTWIGLGRGVVREKDLNKDLYTSASLLHDKTPWLLQSNEFEVLDNYNTSSYFSNTDGFTNQTIFSMTLDNQGNIWFGSGGDGIYMFDGNSFKKYDENDGLPSNYINTSIADLTHGGVWFGTEKGLTYFHNGKFYNYTENDGLSSNSVYNIIIDGEDVWVGTTKGIDRLIINKNYELIDVSSYGKVEGFRSIETSEGSSLKDSKDNLWFGTIKGVTKVDPQKVEGNTKLTRVHISKISLFFEEVNWRQYTDSVTRWFHLPVGLTLPYDKNQLTFEFAGINMRLPEKIKYQWKLEGFDNNWSPVSGNLEANYTNIPPGKYNFLVKASNDKGIWNPVPASFSFKIDYPYYQRWWFILLSIVFIVSAIWGFLAYRLNNIRKIAEAHEKTLETERKMVESERKALRAQINPHFIFNVLNSIQFYIQDNDPLIASRYLSKFAKLMRMILENSKSSSVPIADEIEVLKLYMDLEILRTEYKFEYFINIDKDIDLNDFNIPPMLIQPYVENSIRHGISPSENKGVITIHMHLHNNRINCIIEDNGVGIKASTKKKANGEHISSGMKITGDRLEILNSQRDSKMNLKITDISDIEPGKTGTRVEITIPIE